MKIKISTIIKLILLFVAICLSGFFYVGISFNRIYLIYIAIITVLLCSHFYKPEMRLIQSDKFIIDYIAICLVSIVLILGYTKVAFSSQSIQLSLAVAYPYFMVLFAVPILCCLLRDGDEQSIFKALNIFALIWYIIVFAQYLVYPNIIIPAYFGDSENLLSGIFFRSGGMRMDLQMFGNLMIVYNFYKVYVRKVGSRHRIWHFGMLALGIFELIVIQQTRMYISCIAVCMMVIILSEGNGKKGLLKKAVVVVLAIVAISQTTFVSSLLESVFSSSSALRASTNARIYSWGYYFDYFTAHPFCGFGFANASLFNNIVHGSIGYAYIDDVGIVGQMARLGLFVIPIYIVLIGRYLKILKKIKHNFKQDVYVLYCALFAYILVTSVTLIMLDPQRVMLYPLSLAMFEFKNIQISNMRKETAEIVG